MSLMRCVFLFLSAMVLSVVCMAQTAAPAAHELIDVASLFNGAYPYKNDSANGFSDQIKMIRHAPGNFNFIDIENGKNSARPKDLFYALAAPATIEMFHIGMNLEEDSRFVPRRIEFALSQSPKDGFQTVAVFDVPPRYFSGKRTAPYDLSIPVTQKISGRYVRITLSGGEFGHYRISRFNAEGRFDQALKLREDFSGIYTIFRPQSPKDRADQEMTVQQKGTAYLSYVILHQEGGQIRGCYVHGIQDKNAKESSTNAVNIVSEVLGTLNGGVENSVFRFTRAHAADGSQRQGAIVLAPVGASNKKNAEINIHSIFDAYMLMLDDTKPADTRQDATNFYMSRFSNTPVPCAVAGQKEKTATEAMQESLEKTGKVQLYGVNFDFDADTLRPESDPVLDEVVKLAKANPAWKFEIGGHTDSIGAAAYNQTLSERRAASVVRYLTDKGVEAARLQAKGYGASRPLVPNAQNDAGHAQNRRVELVKQP